MLGMDPKKIGKVNRLSDQECRLEIRSTFAKGLDGLRVGDRIQVLYWMHELSFRDRRTLLAVGDGEGPAVTGRRPARPGPYPNFPEGVEP